MILTGLSLLKWPRRRVLLQLTFGTATERDLALSDISLTRGFECRRLHRTRQREIGERQFALSICGLLDRYPVSVESVQLLRRCKG